MKAFLQLLKNFARPYRFYFIVGPLTKTLEVVFDLLTPLVIAWMIDAGVVRNHFDVCVRGAVLLLTMAVLGFLITLICQKMASISSQGIGTALRSGLLLQAGESDMLAYSKIGSASFLTRSTNDINQVQVAIAMLIRQVIRWPVLAVGSIICAISINLQLGLILSLTLPVVTVIFCIVLAFTNPLFDRMQKKLDQMNELMQETLLGVRPIRAFCRSAWMQKKFSRLNKAQASFGTKAAVYNALLSPATFCVLNGAAVLLLFLARPLVAANSLEAGQVVALLGYMNQLLLAIVYVANLVVIFSKAAISSKRITLALATKTRPNRPGATPNFDAPLLEVRNVSFAFSKSSEPVLSQVSFTLNKGERLGVIGGTGSGKTTLVNLLTRELSLTKGDIRLFGVPAEAYTDAEFARYVSVVPQHAVLFSGTIRDNLLWRDSNTDDAALEKALQNASADFARDLSLAVESGGKNFSGGQRQRLTIARALVGTCDLLILDDATSALDFATEAHIIQAINNLNERPAVIQISQRIHTIQSCDTILVLDNGRVAGLGTHEELLKSSEQYREFYNSQTEADEARYV